MYQKDKKSKVSPSLIQIVLTIVSLALIIGLSIPLSKKLKKQYSVNKEIKTLKEEIEQANTKNSELKKFIEYLNSDQYIEEKARTNLNYKNQDEKVIVVKDNITKNKNSEKESFAYSSNKIRIFESTKIKNVKNWINYFFN